MASNIKILERQLLEMGDYIKFKNRKNENISRANIGWHIAHILKVFDVVYHQMQQSNPAEYKKEFSFARFIVFLTNKIPRGKARSPKAVVPEKNIEKHELELQLQEIKQKLHQFAELDKNANFQHPFFKQLNKPQTLKFLRIHTEHHLKIVREILITKSKD